MKPLSILLGLIAFASPLAAGTYYHDAGGGSFDEPGSDGTLMSSHRPKYFPGYNPLMHYGMGVPFTTSHNGWRLWKHGVYPGAVSAQNPEPGVITYQFTGGGGGGNRGDLLLFWLQEQTPRPDLYIAYHYYTKTVQVQDSEYGYWKDETEYSGYTYAPDTFQTREAAEAFNETASPPEDVGYEIVEKQVIRYAGGQYWILVHTAQTPNHVGNPGSGMSANWYGTGTFNYSEEFGGSQILVEKYNLQRTSGDDNRVQYDNYTFGAIMPLSPAPPDVELTGSSGRERLNP